MKNTKEIKEKACGAAVEKKAKTAKITKNIAKVAAENAADDKMTASKAASKTEIYLPDNSVDNSENLTGNSADNSDNLIDNSDNSTDIKADKTVRKTVKRRRTKTPHQKYLLGVKKDKYKVLGLQIAVLVGFFGLWELLTQVEVLDAFITSSPTRIIKIFGSMVEQGLFRHIGITLYECILSFAISTVLGTLIAMALWWSTLLRRVLEPFIVVINSLPKIALGPIIIVWMGVGTKSIVMMGILICIVVTIISVLGGFMTTDSGKMLLLKSMGANKLQILRHLVLPASVPNLLSVLKINVGLAWVGTIMGEYLVSGAGLGYLIIYGGQVFKLDLVMASTVILCVLAALMYIGVALLEKRIGKHRS